VSVGLTEKDFQQRVYALHLERAEHEKERARHEAEKARCEAEQANLVLDYTKKCVAEHGDIGKFPKLGGAS
jgi:hypothetical protein